MTFTSAGFPIFFIVVIAIYYGIATNLFRKIFLVAASLVLYAAWDARFLALLLGVTLAAWGGAWAINNATDARLRKLLLGASIAIQLAVLAFFKYFVFLTNNLIDLLKLMGVNELVSVVDITLPIGLSFYIFHSISLLVDFYKGKLSDKRPSLLDTALYITFFPQLVSGPIVRSTVFLPQLHSIRRFDLDDAGKAINLILLGYVYKVLLSDNIASVIDPIFSNPAQWGVESLWAASLGYYSQIYFDFAGYTNIAIGISLLFGYRLPKNFDFPYGAASISDFWRRWHISLSFWLRDYLFIPLGGNRGSFAAYVVNIMITMVLGGLWHGASWNFVIWGAFHGVGLVAHKVWLRATPHYEALRDNWVYWLAAFFITQLYVLLLWIFFRVQNFSTALHIVERMFGIGSFQAAVSNTLSLLTFLTIVAPILVDTLIGCLYTRADKNIRVSPGTMGLLIGLFSSLILAALAMQSKPFIYFNF